MNVPPVKRRRSASVGAPAGFVDVFPGWNVWSIWQSDDPIQGLGGAVLNLGLSLERQLKIWVEDVIEAGAPGAEVARNNIGMLRGDNVQIVSGAAGLVAAETRASVPELAGALQLGEEGSKAVLRTVRFFNRGVAAVLSWPHDENYALDTFYQPSATNPITNAPEPGAFGDDVLSFGKSAGTALLIGGGLVLALLVISQLGKGTR